MTLCDVPNADRLYGNGAVSAHIWFFFCESVYCVSARAERSMQQTITISTATPLIAPRYDIFISKMLIFIFFVVVACAILSRLSVYAYLLRVHDMQWQLDRE